MTNTWVRLEAMAKQATFSRDELASLCAERKVKARQLGPHWLIWADAHGLPGDPKLLTLEWVGVKAMADQLKVTAETLRDLCRTRKVKARKIGGAWQVWADEEGYTVELEADSSEDSTAAPD